VPVSNQLSRSCSATCVTPVTPRSAFAMRWRSSVSRGPERTDSMAQISIVHPSPSPGQPITSCCQLATLHAPTARTSGSPVSRSHSSRISDLQAGSGGCRHSWPDRIPAYRHPAGVAGSVKWLPGCRCGFWSATVQAGSVWRGVPPAMSAGKRTLPAWWPLPKKPGRRGRADQQRRRRGSPAVPLDHRHQSDRIIMVNLRSMFW
jgi:hypothetical protein